MAKNGDYKNLSLALGKYANNVDSFFSDSKNKNLIKELNDKYKPVTLSDVIRANIVLLNKIKDGYGYKGVLEVLKSYDKDIGINSETTVKKYMEDVNRELSGAVVKEVKGAVGGGAVQNKKESSSAAPGVAE